jgi:hypothetical protein
MNEIIPSAGKADGPASGDAGCGVQAKDLGGRGGPSRARLAGRIVSGLSKRTLVPRRRPIQDAGAIAVAQPEQWPALQQPRSPQSVLVVRSGNTGAWARSSAGMATAAPLLAALAPACGFECAWA